MKNKVIFVIGIIIIIIFVIATFRYNPIYSIYKEKQVIRNNIDFLNGKSFKGISKDEIDEYNRLFMPIQNLNHYDITNIIEKYIELVMMRKKNNGIKDKKGSRIRYIKDFDKKRGYTFGKDIEMKYDYNIQYYIDSIAENYTKSMLIQELKSILEYEEQDGKIKWMVNDIKERNIELPFNCYLKYIPYSRVMNTEFEKVIDIEFDVNHKFDANASLNNVIIKYSTKTGEIKSKVIELFKREEAGKVSYSCPPRRILALKCNYLAKIELHSHDIDKAFEEHEKKIAEAEKEVMHYWDH